MTYTLARNKERYGSPQEEGSFEGPDQEAEPILRYERRQEEGGQAQGQEGLLAMPVNKSLASALKKKYGSKKGESVYYAMENSKGKTGSAFKKGVKTAAKEGHTVKKFPKKK